MRLKHLTRLAVTLAVFVGIWGVSQADSQAPLFVPAAASPVTVGPGSGQVVLADINGDGRVDLITKHLLTRRLSVRLGDGHGRFARAANDPMNLGYEPGAIALGDINNDWIPDLAVASRDLRSEFVHIFQGTVGGSFSPLSGLPLTVAATQATYKPTLHLIDVNQDGTLDIITANGRHNSIEIFLGNGRGAFSPAPPVRLEPSRDRYSFAMGDVDGDGHLDVVTASSVESGAPGRVAIKRGEGRGAFEDVPGTAFSAPPGARVETLARMNGDRHLDVVLSHETHLTVLLNQGDGTFTPAPGSPVDLGRRAFAVVAADVNRDNKLDLVAATADSLTVLLADGRGFVPAQGSPFRAGPGAYKLAVADVDQDGKLDVAASSFEGDAVTLLLGR